MMSDVVQSKWSVIFRVDLVSVTEIRGATKGQGRQPFESNEKCQEGAKITVFLKKELALSKNI